VNIPLECSILGAFCYLGRGWTFVDLEESTAILLLCWVCNSYGLREVFTLFEAELHGR
jgi:hypothetical protein